MPALFSLGLDFALRAFQSDLLPGERAAAFLDDIYVTAPPHRIRQLFDRLAHHLQHQTGIQLHHGKTQVWNVSGTVPPGITALSQSEAVWVGGHDQPRAQRGLRVLGLPVSTDEYIQAELTRLHAKQRPLLEAIPSQPSPISKSVGSCFSTVHPLVYTTPYAGCVQTSQVTLPLPTTKASSSAWLSSCNSQSCQKPAHLGHGSPSALVALASVVLSSCELFWNRKRLRVSA